MGRFGSQVNGLLDRTAKDFARKTVGFASVREKVDRSRMLQEHIASVASRLFLQQMGIAAVDATDELKKKLFELACASDSDGDVVGGLQAVSECLARFALRVGELKCPQLEALWEDSMQRQEADLRTSLEGILTQFPESTSAKLAQLRRTERAVQADAKSRKKRARALGVSLSLVGMLRLPGRGGFQGVVNYAASILNTPVDFLLGVQNDGEALEVCSYCCDFNDQFLIIDIDLNITGDGRRKRTPSSAHSAEVQLCH